MNNEIDRDLFVLAATAMQGMLANPDPQLGSMPLERIAQLSVEAAQALIAELEKASSRP